MRSVQLGRFGGPEVLNLVETRVPVPSPDEVLVRVKAAGVNFFEILMRQDLYAVTPDLPLSMGVEVAGVIEASGNAVSAELVGMRVAVPLFAVGGAGGYSDYVVAHRDDVCRLPDGLSFEDAAALQVQGLTAFNMVKQGSPKDKAVLVTAAAGGVGSLLVQLARRNGARFIVAAAGSPDKRRLALSLGADVAVDYNRADWIAEVLNATEGRGVDIVYDLVGGEMTRSFLQSLAPGGELLFAALGRVELERADLETVFAKNQSIRGFALLSLATGDELKRDLAWLFERAAGGELKLIQGGRFPLEQVADAHRALESRASVGKVILVP